MLKGTCYKCGRKIWNGIPKEEMEKFGFDTSAYIKKMESEGFTLGYDTVMAGSWGNIHTVSCKPICSICKNEKIKMEDEKKTKKLITKISKELKKVFSCPICEFSATVKGMNTEIFKCASKTEMVNHIKEKHNLNEMKEIIPGEY